MKKALHLNYSVVAVCALPPPVHGQSMVTSHVLRIMSESGCRVQIVNTSPGDLSRSLIYHGKRVLGTMRGCLAILRKRGDFCVYTVCESGWGVVYNAAILACARIKRAPVFLHHHTSAHFIEDSSRLKLVARLSGPAAVHLVLSDAMRERFIEVIGLDYGRCVVLHNSSIVADQVERSERNISHNGVLHVGFLANITREKGVAKSIAVLEKLLAAGVPAKLRLAGPLADDFSKKLVQAAMKRMPDSVEWVGPVSGGDKDAFYRSLDVFVFPSEYRFEAQPLVVLEALSYGVPCLVTDQGYMGELVQKTGIPAIGSLSFVNCAATKITELYLDRKSVV